jgi:hypothetical protein
MSYVFITPVLVKVRLVFITPVSLTRMTLSAQGFSQNNDIQFTLVVVFDRNIC